jgi:hypothetical protein
MSGPNIPPGGSISPTSSTDSDSEDSLWRIKPNITLPSAPPLGNVAEPDPNPQSAESSGEALEHLSEDLGSPPAEYEAPSGVAPHISIQGTADFHSEVDNRLGQLNAKPRGKQLLGGFREPAARGNQLTIHETKDSSYARPEFNSDQAQRFPSLNSAPQNNRNRMALLSHLVNRKENGQNREGTSAEVFWNPNQSVKLNDRGQVIDKNWNNPDESIFALAHEMSHAEGLVTGTSMLPPDPHQPKWSPATAAGQEEFRATGLTAKIPKIDGTEEEVPKYKAPVTENDIRQERGAQERTTYVEVKEQQQPSQGTQG